MSAPDDDLEDDQSPPAPAGTSRRGPIDIDVKNRSEGMRLDRYLALHFPDFSRSAIQDAIDSENVFVKGKVSKPSYKVRRGDTLTEIASQLRVTVESLMIANGLRSSALRAGQLLVAYVRR